MLSINVIDKLEELEGLSEQWGALLENTSSNNIFLTWEWLYTWARHYLGEDRLFVLLAHDGDRLVGIAPLYIRKLNHSVLFGVRQIEFLGTQEVCSSYLDFIVQEKDRKQFLHAIYDYLFEEARNLWDVFYLSEIPAESHSIDIFYERAEEQGKVIEVAGHTCCPVIKLIGSQEHFMKSISANERHTLLRKRRKLDKLGHSVHYYRASSREDVHRDLGDFVKLHEERWRQKGSGGAFESKRFLEFHAEIVDLFSPRGWTYLDFFVVDGEKVAAQYGYLYNGVCYFYLPALNPHVLPNVSLGRLLLFESLSIAIDSGYKEYDLLQGRADYKTAWTNTLKRSVTMRFYNRTFQAALSKIARNGKDVIKVLVR